MLVNSGSSTSFLNQQLADKLQGVKLMRTPCRVKVADGCELCCYTRIPDCVWSLQGHEFSTEMKILSLGTYDAILGMDWLEVHSPMAVDWKKKTLVLSTSSRPIFLQGHGSASTCSTINSAQLLALYHAGALSHAVQLCLVQEDTTDTDQSPIPDCIQQVLLEFKDLFQEPKGLPPWRACEHNIPLIEGAQPFNIRPYRHKPEHKNEIERQIAELL